MAQSKNFRGGSNPHNGAPISQSGQQQYGQGPKPGQQGGGQAPGSHPNDNRGPAANPMTHGGGHKQTPKR